MRVVLFCNDGNYSLVHPLSAAISASGNSVVVIRMVEGSGNQLFAVTTEAKIDSGIEEITVSITCRWCRGLKFGSPILWKPLNFKLKHLKAKI
jgi:hypothetical protein